MLQNRILGAGVSAQAVHGMTGGVANTLTAAGTTTADALLLGLVVNHNVTTTASGTGVRVPALNPGESIMILNSGANTLSVYPASGGTINGAAADAGASVPTLKSCLVFCITSLVYGCLISA